MWKNVRLGIAMVGMLIVGAMMGKSTPISNNSDAKNIVTINQGYPEEKTRIYNKFQEISKNNKNFQEISRNKIDINNATLYELKKLPGVGTSKANLIVKNRPYKIKEDLLNKEIVGIAVYPKIEELIKVGA